MNDHHESNMNSLELLTIKWAEDRNIISQSTAGKQMKKLQEELNELWEGIDADDMDEIVDGIGDMLVVLANVAKLCNTNMSYCWRKAYNEIKDRKGMMIDGIYVKWDDLNEDQRKELELRLSKS